MTGIDYTTPGPLTDLSSVPPAALEAVPADADGINRLAHTLIVHRDETSGLDLPEARFADNQLRHADRIVAAILRLDDTPLHVPREAARRVVGTCRHFAVLTVALLRWRGIPARARCGFATYFQPGLGLDHWVVEHHRDGRWVRTDTEIIGGTVLPHPEDLTDGLFLTGGEAWTAWREGRIDAAKFGVAGTDNFGPAEIQGNAVRDLAALNKVELLPWDEWGRMGAAYKGETGADYDELMDRVATVTAGDDPQEVTDLYAAADLRVPEAMLR
ncbi:transglutaminase domain-containing protein [Dactylosporangium sp. NBC_01737]|uniref:transglutaminase domain-containing protein n=1 Tax=Dactylosporangium sp. NBC_01737 TaxID=2975959 RepID=UPI002E0E6239|nr:transglutaminase domain-containing protein [Dactylosporangium sp. NBC_01737]